MKNESRFEALERLSWSSFVNLDLARRAMNQAGDEPQHRGFAATRRPHERHESPARQREMDAFDRRDAVRIAHARVGELDEWWRSFLVRSRLSQASAGTFSTLTI